MLLCRIYVSLSYASTMTVIRSYSTLRKVFTQHVGEWFHAKTLQIITWFIIPLKQRDNECEQFGWERHTHAQSTRKTIRRRVKALEEEKGRGREQTEKQIRQDILAMQPHMWEYARTRTHDTDDSHQATCIHTCACIRTHAQPCAYTHGYTKAYDTSWPTIFVVRHENLHKAVSELSSIAEIAGNHQQLLLSFLLRAAKQSF